MTSNLFVRVTWLPWCTVRVGGVMEVVRRGGCVHASCATPTYTSQLMEWRLAIAETYMERYI